MAVTMDQCIDKGPGRPAFPLNERMDIIRALAIVDEVIPMQNGLDAIKRVRPDVYVKGKEYEGRLPEQELVEFYGGRVVFTETPRYSSTEILNGSHLQVRSARCGRWDH